MEIVVWLREGVWEPALDAADRLAGPDDTVVLLHGTATASGAAMQAGIGGLFGRGHRPSARWQEAADEGGTALLDAATARAQEAGRTVRRQTVTGNVERAVVTATENSDLLVISRDGDRNRLGPHSLGHQTRFVVDHAACPVLLIWPQAAPSASTIPPPPAHPRAAAAALTATGSTPPAPSEPSGYRGASR